MPGRWQPSRFCDSDDSDRGVIIDGGLTRDEFNLRTAQEMRRVGKIAPWHKSSKYLKYRDGIEAAYLGLSDSINGKYTGGHNKFHARQAQNLSIITANASDARKWGIREGEPFVEQGECRTSLHGDDGTCEKWPINYQNVEILILRIHQYKNHLCHSMYGSILVLVCSKSSKHEPARYRCLKTCENLSHLHRLSVWNLELEAWTCLNHSFMGCHDWVFECTTYGFLSHASDTFIHGAHLVISGELTPLDIKKHNLYDWWRVGIDRENYNINLSEWQNQNKTGLVLTTTEMIWWQWENKFRPAMMKLQEEEEKKGNLHKWEDREYRQKKLSELAKDVGTVINKNPLTKWPYKLVSDPMHCWHTYCERQGETTIYTVLQITRNKKLARKCIKKTRLEWFIKDFNKYINKCSVQRINKKWSFNATGPRYRELSDRFNYIWLTAGWMEHHKIENELKKINIDDLRNCNLNDVSINWDLLVSSYILATKWVVHKHMRRAFAAMFKQLFQKCNSSIRGPMVQCMIHHYRHGWDLIVNNDTQMVFCFLNFRLFVYLLILFVT